MIFRLITHVESLAPRDRAAFQEHTKRQFDSMAPHRMRLCYVTTYSSIVLHRLHTF